MCDRSCGTANQGAVAPIRRPSIVRDQKRVFQQVQTITVAFSLRTPATHRLHGFTPLPLMEDVDLVNRARHHLGPPAIVPACIDTSSRRWQSMGLLQTSVFNLAIYTAWALGADERVLANCYKTKHFDALAIAKAIVSK